MKPLSEVPFSVLDLSPIRQGGTAAESFRNTLDLARHAERLRFNRFWVAEHHSLPGIASAATSVVIAHVAGGTSTIRQYLRAGLVDEMHLAISPVLLGTGEHLLAGLDLPKLGYRRSEHVTTPKAMHIVLTK